MTASDKSESPRCCEGNAVKTTFLYALCGVVFVVMISLPDMQTAIYSNSVKTSAPQFRNYANLVYDDAYFANLDARIARANTIIYNRVPKCGSSAMRAILGTLRRTTKRFSFQSSRFYHTEHMNANQTKALINKLQKFKPPWLFERHLHFLDVSEYGMEMPMYINLVRDPTSRFESEYYFYRFEHRKPMSNERRNRTFDECVFGGIKECQTEDSFIITPFFCGQDKRCLKPTRWALNQAKLNVDKYYGVVGITEDLKPSYALFEKSMPRQFVNMSRVAEQSLVRLKSKYKTHKKPKSSPEALAEMRSRLGLENEFYAFVKQRYIAFLKHYGVQSPLLNTPAANTTS